MAAARDEYRKVGRAWGGGRRLECGSARSYDRLVRSIIRTGVAFRGCRQAFRPAVRSKGEAMPFRSVPQSEFEYGLVAFDADGRERTDDPDGRMSERLLGCAGERPPTDLFFSIHGWKGDMPGAVDQYDRWFGALMQRTDDRAAAEARRPGFDPLLIGIHWPSLPFGDEEMRAGSAFSAEAVADADAIVDAYAARFGDTPAVREDLRTIVAAAGADPLADALPPDARAAYLHLNDLLGLGTGGADAPPDADREGFDPDVTVRAESEGLTSFGGGFSLGGLLSPLRQLSYWAMKKRARELGEDAMHPFLAGLMRAAPAARIHVMGHSFGCVATSAMIAGPGGEGTLPRPVDSLLLVQGAVSLWTYAPAIPLAANRPGYFSALLVDRKVRGPIAVTSSPWDSAVGSLYPLASRIWGSPDFKPTELPKYGAIGAYGAQGLAAGAVTKLPMLPADQPYGLKGGHVYNVDARTYIRKGGGVSGAHNDIDGPEVAHLWWELVRAADAAGGDR